MALKSKSKFKYTPRSEKSVKERAEQQGGRFDSMFKDAADVFRPKDGDSTFRILPPTWDNHDHYGYDIWTHGYVGADNSSYLCPSKMNKGKCPICDAAVEAKRAGEEEDAKKLNPTRRVVCWVINRDGDTDMPELFSMPWTLDRDIAALCQAKKTGKILLIDHPDDGYDVSFKRGKQGDYTKYYGIAIDREPTSIMDDEKDQEKILEFIAENPVPTMLKFYPADHLEKVISGQTGEKDEDEDEEEEETAGRPRGGKRGGKEAEGEDEEIESDRRSARKRPSRDEEDEEDADDEKPRGRHHGRKSEEDDDGEEAEERPRSRSKRGEEDEEEDADEKPRRQVEQRRSSKRDEEEEEDEPAPKKRRAPKDDDEEEGPPFDKDEDGEEEEKEERRPRRGRR